MVSMASPELPLDPHPCIIRHSTLAAKRLMEEGARWLFKRFYLCLAAVIPSEEAREEACNTHLAVASALMLPVGCWSGPSQLWM